MRQREAERLNSAFLASALALPRHFRACAARFRQPDGDRLFTASDLRAGAAAERSALPLAHHLLDFFRCLLAVLSTAALLRHQQPPVSYMAMLSRLCFTAGR